MSRRFSAVALSVVPAAALCAVAAVVSLASAKSQIIVDPPRPPWHPPVRPLPPPPVSVRSDAVSVSSVTLNGTIRDGIAETEVSHVFKNHSGVPQEADFLFPIPSGATVSSFALYDGETKFDAQLLDKDQATRTYEEIVRRRRDPGLLTYEGRAALRARIFPIPANGERRVTLKLLTVLPRERDARKYVWTLAGPYLPNGTAPQHVSVHLTVSDSHGLGNLYSPSHTVQVRRDEEGRAIVTYESGDPTATAATLTENPEFDLYVGSAQVASKVALSVLTYNATGATQVAAREGAPISASEPGYFLVIASPTVAENPKTALSRHVVLVLDRSGSMQGRKIEQAKGALRFALGKLRPVDSFNLMTFSDQVEKFSPQIVSATPANLKRANAWVDDITADGGTNINDALHDGLAQFPEKSASNTLLFFTDGLPTVGQTDHDTIIRNAETENARKSRVFAFGVGYDVDVPFLDTVSHALRGDADYVRPEEDIEVKTSQFVAKTSEPVLENLRLTVAGADARDVYPHRDDLPDLFAGGQVVIAGRYTGANRDVKISLTGEANGVPHTYDLTANFPAASTDASFLPRLWASRKIGYLEDEMRLHPEAGARKEIEDQIIALSKEYGILTSYSALFVPEPMDNVTRPVFAGTSVMGRGNQALGGASGGFGGGGFSSYYSAPSAKSATVAPVAGEAAVNSSQGARAQRTAAQASNSFAYGQMTGADRAAGEALAKHIRTVAGRSFYLVHNVWTDAGYDAAKQKELIKVKAFSPAYFALTRRSPKFAQWAGMGDSVIVVINGRQAVAIDPKEGKDTLTDGEVEGMVKGL